MKFQLSVQVERHLRRLCCVSCRSTSRRRRARTQSAAPRRPAAPKVSRETNDASKFVRDPHRQAPLDQVQPIRTERGEGEGGGGQSLRKVKQFADGRRR